MFGQRSCGCESRPPKYGLWTCHRSGSQSTNSKFTYPAALLMAYDNGMSVNACPILVSSAISANMLFITPIFPFRAPARNRLYRSMMRLTRLRCNLVHYLAANAQNVRDSPNRMVATTKPRVPLRRTGLRPIISERWPHCNTVEASPKK